jgi:hypothetical protein
LATLFWVKVLQNLVSLSISQLAGLPFNRSFDPKQGEQIGIDVGRKLWSNLVKHFGQKCVSHPASQLARLPPFNRSFDSKHGELIGIDFGRKSR